MKKNSLLLITFCAFQLSCSSSNNPVEKDVTTANKIFASLYSGNIISMNPAGSNRTEVVKGTVFSEPCAGKISYLTLENAKRIIAIAALDGSNSAVVNDSSVILFPVLSPDGRRVAYQSNDSILVLWEVSKSQIIVIANNMGRETFSTFSPDGNRIAYYGSDKKLYTINVDGTNRVAITDSAIGGGDGQGVIGWHGNKIVFRGGSPSTPGYQQYLYVINPDGSGKRKLPYDFAYYPALSDDGSMVAFTDQTNDIEIININGTGRKNITNTPADALSKEMDLFPRWSRDGQYLVYTTFPQDYDKGPGVLKTVELKTGSIKVLAENAFNGFFGR